MKLVDNRYKISKIVEESIYNSVYEVIDFGMTIDGYL